MCKKKIQNFVEIKHKTHENKSEENVRKRTLISSKKKNVVE